MGGWGWAILGAALFVCGLANEGGLASGCYLAAAVCFGVALVRVVRRLR